MRNLCTVFLLLVTCATITFAQDQDRDPKNELAATIGRTFVSDQTVVNTTLPSPTVYFGHGTSFELNYARKLKNLPWADLSVEVPAVFNPDENLDYGANQVPRQYSSIFITPAARFRLIPDMAISPWVSFGGGVGRFASSKDLVFSGTNTGDRIKTTGVIQGGTGLDIRLPAKRRQTFFRVEARDDWSGVPLIDVNTGKTRQHNYYVAGGLVCRF